MRFAVENGFDIMGAEYAALFARAGATAFQHPIWLNEFYRHLPEPRSAEPLIITLRSDAALEGLVPLIRRRKAGLQMLETTDLGVSDYSAPVLSSIALEKLDQDPELGNQFRAALGSHDLIRIRPVREEHVRSWKLLLDAEPARLDFAAHAVSLEPPFQDWRSSNIDKSLAGQLSRKRRRWLKQAQVEVKRLTDAEAIRQAIRHLIDWRSGRFEGDPIQQSQVGAFYSSVAASGRDVDFAETWMVSSDGQPSAVLFGLTHEGRFLYLLIGCDYENAGRHSPGMQMYDWIMEDWMARGGQSFDFTIGDEPFKKQFGTAETAMSMFLVPGSIKGRLAATALVRLHAKQAEPA